MSQNNTRVRARSQHDAAQIPSDFQQSTAMELRVRKLRQRFSLAPEVARVIAALAFVGDTRA